MNIKHLKLAVVLFIVLLFLYSQAASSSGLNNSDPNSPEGCVNLAEQGKVCIEDYSKEFSDVYKGNNAVMPLPELRQLLTDTHSRFTYVSDTGPDDWNVIRSGPILGDCEEFALAIRYQLAVRGYSSRVVGTSTDGYDINHAILVHGDYILDNRSQEVKHYTDSNYIIAIVSGLNDAEGWYIAESITQLEVFKDLDLEGVFK